MLATMQRMLQKLTRRRSAPVQAEVIAKLAGVCRRHAWARAVQQFKRFLSDLSASSLVGGDPVGARRAARHLQRRFAEHPES
jgi:hypothetical protein